jgi:hypothetical protein
MEFITVDELLFSGNFTYVVPENKRKKLRGVKFECQVVRSPESPYFSDKTNPQTSFYATLLSGSRDFIEERRDIVYKKQLLYYTNTWDTQVLQQSICSTVDILRGIANLGVALGLSPVLDTTFSDSILNADIIPYYYRFRMFAGTALSVRVGIAEYKVCSNNNPNAERPNDKPDLPEFPPTRPITPSDGYSPRPEGILGRDYEPFPLDDSGSPDPVGDSCDVKVVTFEYQLSQPGQATETLQGQATLFAEIGGIRAVAKSDGSPDIEIESRGLVSDVICGAFRYVGVLGFSNAPALIASNARILSIV